MRGSTVVVGSLVALFAASGAAAQSVSFSRVNPDVPVGSTPVAVATADFDGDEKIDIAVANNFSYDVSVLWGNGDGTFDDSGVPYPIGMSDISAPSAIAVGDFDGDEKIDIVVTDEGASKVSVLLNLGSRMFGPPKITDTGSTPEAVVVGDFDRNGKADVATADLLGGSVTVLYGVGDGTFTNPQVILVGDGPMGLAGGDVDGDGMIDVLVVANSEGGEDGTGTVSVLKRLEGGVFEVQPEISSDTFDVPFGIALADLNGDSKLDIVAVNNEGDSVSVLLGNADLTFQPATLVPLNVGTMPEAVVAADFNGDGKMDIATSDSFDDKVSVLIGIGNGTFMPYVQFKVGAGPSGLATDDFNADHKPDLTSANMEFLQGNTVSVLLNTSAACFGDCDNSGTVNVTDIVKMVNIALDVQPVSTCMAGAQDGKVTVTEIIKAVNNALGTCPA